MDRKAALALAGLSIIALSLMSTFWGLAYVLEFPKLKPDRVERSAYKVGHERTPQCAVTLRNVNRKVMLGRSFNMLADVSLEPSASTCRTELQLSAAAFDVKPESIDCELSKDSSHRTRLVYFNILPKEAGTQQVVFTASGDDGSESRTMEFIVYEYPHVNPAFSFWFPTGSCLFGGMLSLPWWIEFFRNRGKAKVATRARPDDSNPGPSA